MKIDNEYLKKELIQDLAYDLYKISWLSRISLCEFMSSMRNYYEDEVIPNSAVIPNIYDGTADIAKECCSFQDYYEEHGFSGDNIYVCKEEFLSHEFIDPNYMKALFRNDEFYSLYQEVLAKWYPGAVSLDDSQKEEADVSSYQVEKLKRALFNSGIEAISDFCDMELSGFEDKDTLDNILDDILAQMPDDIFEAYYNEYVISPITNTHYVMIPNETTLVLLQEFLSRESYDCDSYAEFMKAQSPQSYPNYAVINTANKQIINCSKLDAEDNGCISASDFMVDVARKLEEFAENYEWIDDEKLSVTMHGKTQTCVRFLNLILPDEICNRIEIDGISYYFEH